MSVTIKKLNKIIFVTQNCPNDCRVGLICHHGFIKKDEIVGV
jgi:hypothetical protein